MNFFGFFLISEIIFAKRLRSTLKKFLDNRSKRFENTTQTLFDEQDFQKLIIVYIFIIRVQLIGVFWK